MDAQELLAGNLSSEYARENEAAREENQFELQSERAEPLRFFVGFFWAVCFSLVFWSLLALFIYLVIRLVTNG